MRMKQEWRDKKKQKDTCENCKVWRTKCNKHQPTESREGREEVVCRDKEEEETGVENPTENPTEDPVTREEVAYKAFNEGIIGEIINELIEETTCEGCRNIRDGTRQENCAECGEGLEKEEETETVLVGMDVVSLFPSMTTETTGKIVRDRVTQSTMKWKGSNGRKQPSTSG